MYVNTILRRVLVAGLAAVILASGAYLIWRATRPSAKSLIAAARVARNRGQIDEARRIVNQAVGLHPTSAPVCVAAAELELASEHLETALVHLERAEYDGSSAALTAIGSAGDILYRLRRMEEAEQRFRRVLALDPPNVMARQRLAQLAAIAGRRWDATRFYFEIIKAGQFDTHDLALLGDPELAYKNRAFVDLLAGPATDDVWLTEGAARHALFRSEGTKAARLYGQLAAMRPGDIEIQAGYGRALFEAGAVAEFLKWYSRLPAAALDHYEIWDVCGRFAQQRQEYDVAIRCYWEAIRRDPNLRQAHYQLAGLLHQRGDERRAQAFRERAEQLHAFSETLSLIHIDTNRLDVVERAAELAATLARPWETWGWVHAAALRSGRRDHREEADRLRTSLTADTPLTLPVGNLALKHDLSDYPSPAWRESSVAADGNVAKQAVLRAPSVRFADMAADAGIDFTYHNGDDPREPGIPIWKSSGGGVAALDYDGDAWPDLYFTQGCDWPPQAGQSQHLDRMFRNLGNGRFLDVTASSGLGDERYGQGVSAGDFDADGFGDLHVANIFANRLYRNNGDGTFTDCTEEAGIKPGGWTTSSLLADLNGDALPEIYEVTYVAGREPFEHVCHDNATGKPVPRTCSPTVFAAEQDRLYLNLGDGRFEDISDRAGIRAPDGKGLGIAAGDFDGSGRLSLYVANDTTANFLFLNRTTNAGDIPTFAEEAILRGCALDSDGRAQASMGIAVDDADGDGLLDLYITNFHKEYNVMYRQLPGGMFADVSNTSGLKPDDLVLLGFGTQFVDGDLDGWPDLVVANGSVDDFGDHGLPFRMRAQYFANRGGGRFVELPSEQLGEYFQRDLLGRSMAKLDWNRDGREDVVISHLDTPAALVTNTTPSAGRFLAIELRGVLSNRDAIGALVQVTQGGIRRSKQLTAGDGYQASNERRLIFGLGNAESVDEFLVRWPSGGTQVFTDLKAGIEYLLIEGRSELSRFEPATRN